MSAGIPVSVLYKKSLVQQDTIDVLHGGNPIYQQLTLLSSFLLWSPIRFGTSRTGTGCFGSMSRPCNV